MTPWPILNTLVSADHVTGWLAVVLLPIVLLWLVARYGDRLAGAMNLWMLAWDRRAARKAALSGKTVQERKLGLAVLDCLQLESAAHAAR